jgi:hypothetical protein
MADDTGDLGDSGTVLFAAVADRSFSLLSASVASLRGSSLGVELDTADSLLASASFAATAFSFAAFALSKAACLNASGTEGVVVSFEPSDGASFDSNAAWLELAGSFEGVALADDASAAAFAGVLAGVVVIDVVFVATGPIASLSSPNSFQSSICSRSWSTL